jgi:hypothetical protein
VLLTAVLLMLAAGIYIAAGTEDEERRVARVGQKPPALVLTLGAESQTAIHGIFYWDGRHGHAWAIESQATPVRGERGATAEITTTSALELPQSVEFQHVRVSAPQLCNRDLPPKAQYCCCVEIVESGKPISEWQKASSGNPIKIALPVEAGLYRVELRAAWAHHGDGTQSFLVNVER